MTVDEASTYAYVVGGFNDASWCDPLSTTERVDLSSFAASTTAIPVLTTGRGDKAVATLNGKIHVLGGETKDSSCASEPLTDVEIYESEDGMWRVGTTIPDHRFRVVAAVYGEDSVYLIGGQSFLVGTLGQNGSYYDVEANVLEFREDAYVDDGHDDDAHGTADAAFAVGTFGLVFGIAGLCAGLFALFRRSNEAKGMNGCTPQVMKASVVDNL